MDDCGVYWVLSSSPLPEARLFERYTVAGDATVLIRLLLLLWIVAWFGGISFGYTDYYGVWTTTLLKLPKLLCVS